jgi:hypothetical protein
MKVLFVCYGGGHVEMCLPVLRALRAADPHCETVLLALTTAFSVAREAGESPLGYRDLIQGPRGERALAYGRELSTGQPQHPQVAPEESAAYLGLNFMEWVDAHGEAAARERWNESGRKGFFPVQLFTGLLRRLDPDVVVTTNSPRSEQAAIEAAALLGIPSLSMVDLFALPGDPFLQRRVHASRIAVVAESTRANLVAAGIEPQRVAVTGNPVLDALVLPEAVEAGRRWRAERGWSDAANVVLWAGHKEPADAQPAAWAGTGLGTAVQQRLVQWLETDRDACLAVRYHPNEWNEFAPPSPHPRIHWSRPDQEPLLPVLMAADTVVVQATTVGVQAHAAGKRLLGLVFSPLVRRTGMDYGALGLGEAVVSLDALVPALQREAAPSGRYPAPVARPAAPRIASMILELARRRIQS